MARALPVAMVVAAAGGAILGWGAAVLLGGPAGPRLHGSGDDEINAELRRLREEGATLRARLAEAEATARAGDRADPGTGPADAAPAIERPAARAPGMLFRPAATPAAPPSTDRVRDWIDALRAACASGDTAAAAALVASLSTGGATAADLLEPIVRDISAGTALRAAALQALAAARPDGIGRTLALLLADASAEAQLRAVALEAAAGPSGADGAVRDLLRGILAGEGGGPEWAASLRALVHHDPDAAIPWVRDGLVSGDAARRDQVLAAVERGGSPALLPVLTEAVNREQHRDTVTRLINSIARIKDRPWSAVQMTGEPDTPIGGDLGTAWASKQPDMGEVWIELDYERAVVPAAVRIRETLSPGAVARVLAADGGGWTILWEGTADRGAAPRWFEPALATAPAPTRTIRIVLETNRVNGWNEIDAVELVGDGLSQWAVAARASSSYAD